MVNQAIRSAQAVSQALAGTGDRVAVHKELPGRTGAYRPHPLKAPPRSIPPARLRPVLGCYACVGGAWWATLKRLSASRREFARGC